MKKRIARLLRQLDIKPKFRYDVQKTAQIFEQESIKVTNKAIPSRYYCLAGKIRAVDAEHPRGAIAIIHFLDKNGEKLSTSEINLNHSEVHGYFSYLPLRKNLWHPFQINFKTPAETKAIAIQFRTFVKANSAEITTVKLIHKGTTQRYNSSPSSTELTKKSTVTTPKKTKVKRDVNISTDTLCHTIYQQLRTKHAPSNETVSATKEEPALLPIPENCLALKLTSSFLNKSIGDKDFILCVSYLDKAHNEVPEPYEFITSGYRGPYIYVGAEITVSPPADAAFLKFTITKHKTKVFTEELSCQVKFNYINSAEQLSLKDLPWIFKLNLFPNSNLKNVKAFAEILIAAGWYTNEDTYLTKGIKLLYQRCGFTHYIHQNYSWLLEADISPSIRVILNHSTSFTKPIAQLVPTLPPSIPSPNYVVEGKEHLLYCLNNSLPYNPNGYSSRSHSIAKAIYDKDVDVTCLTRMGYPWERKQDCQNIETGAYRDSHLIDNISYQAVKGPAAQTLALDHYFQYSADQIFREAQKVGATAIQSASNFLTGIPALIAARHAGVPFYYEIRGLWQLTEQSKLPCNTKQEKHHFMDEAELYLAQECDHLFVQTNQLKELFITKGIDQSKISVLPNGIDQKLFHVKEKQTSLFEKYNLKENVPTFGYAGSIVKYEGHKVLVDAISKLNEDSSPIQGFIAGTGDYLDSVKKYAIEKGVTNINFVGVVPKNEVPDLLNLADMIIIPRLESDVTTLVAPLKPLEGLALGKIVIASDLPPIRDQLREFGEYVEPGNSKSLYKAIKSNLDKKSDPEAAAIPTEFQWSSNGQLISAKIKADAEKRNLPKTNKKYTFALIADKFTRSSFEGIYDIVLLDPKKWEEQLKANGVDFFLCESAWEGNDGAWTRKIGYYGEEEFSTLKSVLNYCNQNSIPTLFWNKEDPVHFNRFSKTVVHFDHVFTTDANCIPKYLGLPDTKIKTVRSLPFFANRRIHKPTAPSHNRANKFCYAGTYYGKRYPDRTKALDLLLEATKEKLTIYNRQSDNPESPYQFPESMEQCLNSSIDYESLVKKYSDYDFHINGNSVTNSPTMLSRRVLEIAACESFVFSTPSLALSELLDNLVPAFPNKETISSLIETLANDENLRAHVQNQLTRFVLGKHMLEYRLVDLLRTLGKEASPQYLDLPDKVKLKSKVVTVAGHDLKFAKEHLLALRDSGYSVIIDHWNGHAQHQPIFSNFAIKNSHKLMCEWTLGNAVYYSKNKLPGQRLVTRLHLQEIHTPHIHKIKAQNINKIIFVGPHIIRDAVRIRPDLTTEQNVLIPNFIDTTRLTTNKHEGYQYNIGIVGIVPERKRFDRALDILEKLLASDPRYTLRVKGKLPKDFPWMLKREEEMKYYNAQFDRINKQFKDRVIFDGFGDDMDEWYQNVGYVLSPSDFESFHLTVADGAATASFPILYPWEGADEIYPADWVIKDTADAASKIIRLNSLGEENRSSQRLALWGMISDKMNRDKSISQFLETFQDDE